MSLNDVRLSGGFTRDPEFSFTPNGWPVWRATIAVNGTKYDAELRAQVVKTSFVLLSANGYTAEALANAGFAKGDEIKVEGELDQNEWTNKETGKQERRTQVVVNEFTPLRLKAASQTRPQQPADQGYRAPAPQDDPWAVPPRQPNQQWGNGPDSEPPF